MPEGSDKAVVSIKTDRGTSYDIYVQILNEIKAAYRICRDEYVMSNQVQAMLRSKGLKAKTYDEINKIATDPLHKKRKEYKEIKKFVKEKYPMRISEAEPVDYSK